MTQACDLKCMHCRAGARSKRTSAGNDFREMEDSTRCGQARSPRGNPNLHAVRTNIGERTYSGAEPCRSCSEPCGTHASEPLPKLARGLGQFWRIRGSPLRKGFCARIPVLVAPAETGSVRRFKAKEGVFGITSCRTSSH
jgi:hypothetical protein